MGIDVKEIVVKDIITIGRGKSVRSASSMMGYFNVKCLLVMEEDYPVGMVTRSDIDKSLDPDMVDVGSVMSDPLVWVRYNTTLTEVAELMETENVSKVPIFGNLSSGPVLLGMYMHEKVELEEPVELDEN
ncbi:MAG: CBS domain-containing protein [Candidatus Bathyarchaeia archaeon]|jgi:CBS domain-containing protein